MGYEGRDGTEDGMKEGEASGVDQRGVWVLWNVSKQIVDNSWHYNYLGRSRPVLMLAKSRSIPGISPSSTDTLDILKEEQMLTSADTQQTHSRR